MKVKTYKGYFIMDGQVWRCLDVMLDDYFIMQGVVQGGSDPNNIKRVKGPHTEVLKNLLMTYDDICGAANHLWPDDGIGDDDLVTVIKKAVGQVEHNKALGSVVDRLAKYKLAASRLHNLDKGIVPEHLRGLVSPEELAMPSEFADKFHDTRVTDASLIKAIEDAGSKGQMEKSLEQTQNVLIQVRSLEELNKHLNERIERLKAAIIKQAERL